MAVTNMNILQSIFGKVKHLQFETVSNLMSNIEFRYLFYKRITVNNIKFIQ